MVTIFGPGHQSYTTPAHPGETSSAPDFISAITPDGHHVIVLLRHPRGGLYNIQPAGSSGPITGVAAAQDVPPARIAIRVTRRHRRRRQLSYRIRNYVAGTRVQFVERGHDSVHVLGTVHRAHGVIRFVPEDAIGRRRAVFAYLRSPAGAPLRTLVAGHYVAPAAVRPGRVRGLHFARHGTKAVLTWHRAVSARQYLVVLHGSDGRVQSAFVSAGRRALSFAQVLPFVRLSVTVIPEGGPNMLAGPRTRGGLPPSAPARSQVLSCRAGRCTGSVVSGSLNLVPGEVHARLYRGGHLRATGIASDLRGPSHLGLAVTRALPHGRYRLVLSYRRRHVSRALMIR
jgi:hypothetical protein